MITADRAKQIIAGSQYGELKMSPNEDSYVRKIWREHPNGEMSIYTTLLMIGYGYQRALYEINAELNWE